MPPKSAPESDKLEKRSANVNYTDGVRSRLEWWLVIMVMIIGAMFLAVIFNDQYREAWEEIVPGLQTTIIVTLGSFVASMFLGLVLGVARVSNNTFIQTIARVYIEFVRGMPMLVWLFVIAFVLTPDAVDLVNWILRTEVKTRSVSNTWRGAIALCLFYAAFLAEVFRAGIQSVDFGQKEAGRALGLTDREVLRKITLPQAFRNMLPAFGNDLISLMKDTSLISVIAGAELTYNARIYSGSSFRFREAFFVLAVFYVTLTLVLSLLFQLWERYLTIPGRSD
jgi:polar amino acid transport system permease protein